MDFCIDVNNGNLEIVWFNGLKLEGFRVLNFFFICRKMNMCGMVLDLIFLYYVKYGYLFIILLID